MDRDNLKTIDDSTLESVSGGHGHIGKVIEGAVQLAEHVVGDVLDKAADLLHAVGDKLLHRGE